MPDDSNIVDKIGGLIGSVLKPVIGEKRVPLLLEAAGAGLVGGATHGDPNAVNNYWNAVQQVQQRKQLQQLWNTLHPDQPMPPGLTDPAQLVPKFKYGKQGEIFREDFGAEPRQIRSGTPQPPKNLVSLELYVQQHPEDVDAARALENYQKDATARATAAARAGAEAAGIRQTNVNEANRRSRQESGQQMMLEAADLRSQGRTEEADMLERTAHYYLGGERPGALPKTAEQVGADAAAKLDAQQRKFIEAGNRLKDFVDVLSATDPERAKRMAPLVAQAQSGMKPFNIGGRTAEEIQAAAMAQGNAQQDLAKQIAPSLLHEAEILRAAGKTELADRLGVIAGEYASGIARPQYGPQTAEEKGAAAAAVAQAQLPTKLLLQHDKQAATTSLAQLNGALRATENDKRIAATAALEQTHFFHAEQLKDLDEAHREKLLGVQNTYRVSLEKMRESAQRALETQKAEDKLTAQHDAQAAAKAAREYEAEVRKTEKALDRAQRQSLYEQQKAERKAIAISKERESERKQRRAEQFKLRMHRLDQERIAGKDMQTSLEGLKQKGLTFRNPVSGEQIRSGGKVQTGADALQQGAVALNKEDENLFTNRQTVAEMSAKMLELMPGLSIRDQQIMQRRARPTWIQAGSQWIQQWQVEVEAGDSPTLKQYLALMKKVQVTKIRELFPTGRLPVYDQQLFMGKDIGPKDTLTVQESQLKDMRQTAVQQMRKMLNPTTTSPFAATGDTPPLSPEEQQLMQDYQ